jgi:hypothetical protein
MNRPLADAYKPPTARLDPEGAKMSRPWLCALGVIVGVLAGILGIYIMVLLTWFLFLFGLLFLVAMIFMVVSFWRKRFKNLDRATDFSLGFLVVLSIFQFLAICLLLLRQVPNDRKAGTRLTPSSTRTPPALSSAHSLRSASSASFIASAQAGPVSFIR